ncbi:MAG: hypothetical protein Q7J25_09200 [Vicinamibacterales bacterium]|nr:hypothetical protein [Vicinamibacterales bacterium]
MTHTGVRASVCTLAALLFLTPATSEAAADDKNKKVSLSLKVTPSMATAPARVRASVEIRGGPDNNEELYCPSVEWEWGDDTTSESSADCAPYEAGKSQIRRRYSAEHTFRSGGQYKVVLRLKQKNRIVAFTSSNLQVQGGISEQ